MSWLKNSVIYQIVVDRFSTGSSRLDRSLEEKTSKNWMGGNLKGITKKLSYFKELGVSAIYITPIFYGKYYHGYHVIDYFEIDEHFGNKKDFSDLVNLLHKNGMKIIFDYVPNHCSDLHPFFKDAIKNPNSNYHDWFVFEKWPNKYLSFLGISELPKFNFNNKEVRDYLISVAQYWVENFELDALRVDHAIGPPLIFWKELKRKIKIPIIAEAGFARGFTCGDSEKLNDRDMKTLWILNSFGKKEIEKVKNYSNSQTLESLIEVNELFMKKLELYFDAFIDFVFRDIVWAFAKKEITFDYMIELLSNHYKKFKKPLITLLSNHDFNRFRYVFGKDLQIVFSSFQSLIDQPMLIYYGEETGLSQKSRVDNSIPYSDIEARRFMNWSSIDKELLNHYKRIVRLKLR